MIVRIPAKIKSAYNKMLYSRLPDVTAPCIARVLHDKECSRIRGTGTFPWLSRFYDQNWKIHGLPETVRYSGGKGSVELTRDLITFWEDVNTAEAVVYTVGKDGKKKDQGWNNAGWSRVEQLVFGGDFVRVLEKNGSLCRIQSYYNHGGYPKPMYDDKGKTYNLLNDFGVVYTNDVISRWDGGPCYSFPISDRGETLWMDSLDITYVRAL